MATTVYSASQAEDEAKRLGTWKEEDKAEALRVERLRRRELTQARAEDRRERDRQFELSKEGFDFGKEKWGQEFAFTKEETQKKWADREREWRDRGLDRVAQSFQNTLNNDQAVKNTILTRVGI